MDIYIAPPAEDSPNRYTTPGSITETCQDCGARVSIAPSGQKVIGQCIVLCEPCGLARMKSESKVEILLLEGQAEEIKAFRKRN